MSACYSKSVLCLEEGLLQWVSRFHLCWSRYGTYLDRCLIPLFRDGYISRSNILCSLSLSLFGIINMKIFRRSGEELIGLNLDAICDCF